MYKSDNEEKIPRLKNDGEDFTVSAILYEFPITSIQQTSDCFRMGRLIKQFRWKCEAETQPNASVNTSNAECISINSLSPSGDDTADPTSPGDDSHHISTESEDDTIVCDISIQAEKARLSQAKQVHELVLGITDASLVKKFLKTSDAPHLDTKALIQKLDEVAKTVQLEVSTNFTKQKKDPVPGTVRSWIRKKTPPETKSPEIQQSKVSCDIVKISIDFLLKKKDSSFAKWTVGQARRGESPFLSPFIPIPCILPTGTLQRNGWTHWSN